MYCFKLNSTERKIFSALISSKITYPAIPLHCTNVTSMKILQRIHNRGARFITGISKLEERTRKYINERAELRPVNKIRTKMREEFEGVYTYRTPSKKSWPLSIPVMLEGELPELYG